MNKFFTSIVVGLLLAFLPSQPLRAQDRFAADSITFVNVLWQTDTLDGFFLRSFHFDQRQLFNSCQYIYVIEIPKDSKAHLAFVSDTVLTLVSDFAKRHQALAAINGSFFNMSTGAPVCYLRIDGKELGENVAGQDTVNRKYYQNAAIRLLPSGHPCFTVPASNRKSEAEIKDKTVMTAGPMLIHRGENVPQHLDRRFVYGRHNRTAIGLKKDGTIVLVVADGRSKGQADGLSLPELTRVMRWIGCCEAANLDGGGSTTMYVKGRGTEGIVNHPSDNGRYDAGGQRRVANAVLVVK